MADLRTIDGTTIHFSPASVLAVLDKDPNTGADVTAVLGLTPGALRIEETVDGFLTRIGVSANFASLTRPDHGSIRINAKAVTLIRPPIPDEYGPEVHSVIAVGSLKLAVDEDPANAKAAIVAHGGTI